MKKSKILVFTYANNDSHHGCSFHKLLELTNPSKEEYCKIHGYDFYCQTENLVHNNPRDIGWEKIRIINDVIDKYDYIFYVECDAIIMNHTIKIENLVDDNYDFIIGRGLNDPPEKYHVNCGSFIVKCSEWTKQFMKNLYEKKDIINPNYPQNWAEQAAIMTELINNSEVRKHFKITHLRYLNSYYRPDTPQDNFEIGDFVLHGVGMPNTTREKLLDECRNKIIKMPKVGLEVPCV